MTAAFCPSHTTCFFRPVHSDNILEKGSRGVGIRLGAGTTVHMYERTGSTKITINGKADDARITRHVLEHMAPGRSFEADVECGLPLGQGFGMSASGAVAAALCVAEMTGRSRAEAFEAAHTADAVCGGGLGDVAGLMHEGDVPIRVKAGMPPFGRVIDRKIVFRKMTLAVMGRKIPTADILGDDEKLKRICDSGDSLIDRFIEHGTKDMLFGMSNQFSYEAGVRGTSVAEAICALEKNGIRSAMCMLGNSIFTDAPEEEVRSILGNSCQIFSSCSTDEPARIIQKA